jgi:hypothetical protein
VLKDITAPTTGAATYACTNGVWSAPLATSCAISTSTRGISSLNGEKLWTTLQGANGSTCSSCHGAPTPDVIGNKYKINNAAGTAGDHGYPTSIVTGIQNVGSMNEFSAAASADLIDLAAYVNAVRYGKALTDEFGNTAKLPFDLSGPAVFEVKVLLPSVLIGSAPSIRTTVILGAATGSTLTVASLALSGTAAFTLTTDSTANACNLVSAFTLTAGQTCTMVIEMKVVSPGAVQDNLVVTEASGQATPVSVSGLVTAQANGGTGGGGCTMRSTPGLFDPVLILLSVLSLGVLGLRRKKQPRI